MPVCHWQTSPALWLVKCVTYFFVIGKSKALIWMNQALSEGEYRNPGISGWPVLLYPLAGYFPPLRQITSCRYPTSKAGSNVGRRPEYAVPESESGYLLEMRYTVLLSISRDKATLLTDKRSKPVASDIIPTSLVGLRGEGGWPPPLSVVLTVTLRTIRGCFVPRFISDRSQADQVPISEGTGGSR